MKKVTLDMIKEARERCNKRNSFIRKRKNE